MNEVPKKGRFFRGILLGFCVGQDEQQEVLLGFEQS